MSKGTDFFNLEPKWLDTDGGERIRYHDEGRGFPIVFVHGSAVGVSAAANWWLNIPVLQRQFRCLALDLIGFGETQPRPDEVWGLDSWVAQLARFVDALKLERFALVGNSLGGRIALELTLAKPARVAGLITMGTVGISPPKPPAPRPADASWTAADVRASMLRMVHDPRVVSDGLIESRHALVSAPGGAEKFHRAMVARNGSVDAKKLTPESLQAMQTPTLIIHGREDKIIPLSSSVELASLIPNADLVSFAGCGHWAQVERLDDFNALAQQFVHRVQQET